MRAEEAGLPFPFSGRRAPSEREVTLAKAKAEAAAKAKAKAAAKDKATAKAKAEDGRGTPEFGREEAKRASS
jgi:membrane protein involved in colicin uptake